VALGRGSELETWLLPPVSGINLLDEAAGASAADTLATNLETVAFQDGLLEEYYCSPKSTETESFVDTATLASQFTIFIRRLGGGTITLCAHPDETIGSLLERSINQGDIPCPTWRAMFAGQDIGQRPERTLVELGLRNESTLDLVLRLRDTDAAASPLVSEELSSLQF
jgi:hypothetical protein